MTQSSVTVAPTDSSVHAQQSTVCHTSEDRKFNQLSLFKVFTEMESEIFLRWYHVSRLCVHDT